MHWDRNSDCSFGSGSIHRLQECSCHRSGNIVTKRHAATITSGDIPPLGVIVARSLVQIVGNPRSEVVITELEQSSHIVRTTHDVEYSLSCIVLQLLEETAVMFVDVYDLADLAAHQLMERVLLQQGISDVGDARSCKPCTHSVQVVQIGFQVLFCEIARNIGYVVKKAFPIHIADFREFQD